MNFTEAIATLQHQLGTAIVHTEPVMLYAKSFDATRISQLPSAVIMPQQLSDVGIVLKLANEYKIAVTVRGGGTSLTGSTIPERGGWVLDLSNFKALTINAAAGMADVEPGVTIAELQTAATAEGWMYPPDPASRQYATIGGTIATNASGMTGAKYGATREYILALRGYLPTGEYVTWGAPVKKFAAGFNLRDLWIGSEGMLGVIAGAVVKLVPAPQTIWTILVEFKDDVALAEAMTAWFKLRLIPRVAEFIDAATLQACVAAGLTLPFKRSSDQAVVVLLELDGATAAVSDDSNQVLAWAKQFGIWHDTATGDNREALWTLRRSCSGAMRRLAPTRLNEDIVVPLDRFQAFMEQIEQLRRSSKLIIAVFGHIGDGNMHVNICFDDQNEQQRIAAWQAVQQLMQGVHDLGGVISGEHGIGLAKSKFLALQHSAAAIQAMQNVKHALDPNNILNPGKMFTPTDMSKFTPEQVSLPWESIKY